jgi:hypothetical protein
MSSFTEPLVLTPAAGGLWSTGRALTYEIGCKGSGLAVRVPAGFITDLGSIPGLARALINPADSGCAAAYVLHDYLCRVPGFTRTIADAVLFEALQVLGVPLWRVVLIYNGVSLWRALRFAMGRR